MEHVLSEALTLEACKNSYNCQKGVCIMGSTQIAAIVALAAVNSCSHSCQFCISSTAECSNCWDLRTCNQRDLRACDWWILRALLIVRRLSIDIHSNIWNGSDHIIVGSKSQISSLGSEISILLGPKQFLRLGILTVAVISCCVWQWPYTKDSHSGQWWWQITVAQRNPAGNSARTDDS
jgi:hypothetical protein